MSVIVRLLAQLLTFQVADAALHLALSVRRQVTKCESNVGVGGICGRAYMPDFCFGHDYAFTWKFDFTMGHQNTRFYGRCIQGGEQCRNPAHGKISQLAGQRVGHWA
ncbi:hypothetical protein BJI67_05910 [Acidihalobacter aeolianus]|uniref:Secreted protein n=1 Tax=Acidihalobacter aeolianus TaxID=2792603 RepID=A0A1D8K6R0_9GAMM|nr:hypothetical protein BJI67_05910 [Acidihalobacter aeolianus]